MPSYIESIAGTLGQEEEKEPQSYIESIAGTLRQEEPEPEPFSIVDYYRSLDDTSFGVQPETEKPGVIETGLKGVARGTLGLAETVGTAAEYIGGRTGLEGLQEQGKLILDNFHISS